MDLGQYQTLQNKLYAVGREADKFVVSVTNVKNDTDIFNTTYETKGIGSGIIIADTGDQLLILTEKKTIAGASSIRVTFVDGETVKAELQQYDGNTGIAVLRVKAADVSKETKKQITVATLGSSVSISQGQTVLAVGSPIGTIHSILTGNITSNRNTISTMDCNYTIFTTDMVGSADASGALINTNGEIIGFILQDYNMQKEQTTLAAVSISELKGVIELLSNDKSVPYLGLRISTVTDEIAEDYQMPKGVYVRDVALDSPAMEAGFQSGDVITKINGEAVLVAEDYEKLLRGVWNVPEGFVPRLVIMVAGVLILSLSASLYQTADLGIAPYDSLSIIMRDRLPLPYFWCRIITDATCAAVCWLLGGIVGLGTLVCALGLGPFIHFFNKHISEKLCGYPEKGEKTPV